MAYSLRVLFIIARRHGHGSKISHPQAGSRERYMLILTFSFEFSLGPLVLGRVPPIGNMGLSTSINAI